MRKLGIFAIVLCAMSVAVPAAAGTSKYNGTTDQGGRIAFKLEKKKGKQRVLKFGWAKLPVDCKGKAEISGGFLTFKVPVKRDAFDATAIVGRSKNPEAMVKIHGEIDGGSASGRISLAGRKLPIGDSTSEERANCDSGKLEWTVAR